MSTVPFGSQHKANWEIMLEMLAQSNANNFYRKRFVLGRKLQPIGILKTTVKTLTGELNSSSKRCFGSFPFFGLTSIKICFVIGKHRRNFSIITLPRKPVPPVIRTFWSLNVSAILSGISSSVIVSTLVSVMVPLLCFLENYKSDLFQCVPVQDCNLQRRITTEK